MDTDQFLLDSDESLARCERHLAEYREKTDVGARLPVFADDTTTKKASWWSRLFGRSRGPEEVRHGR